MKSWEPQILNRLISGSEMMTLGLPFSFLSFAWASPIALLTESRPGMTLWGPQISPPFSMISRASGLLWFACFEKSCWKGWFVKILSIFYKTICPLGLLTYLIVLIYTSPPALSIHYISSGSPGLWSQESTNRFFPQSVLSNALESPTLIMKQSSSTIKQPIIQDPAHKSSWFEGFSL